MRYTVEGLDRRTGLGTAVDVEATSLRDAEDQALAARVLPSKVYPARATAVASGAAAATGDAAGAPLGRPTRSGRSVAVAILTTATVLVALAVAGAWAARRYQQAERERQLGRQRNTQMFIDYEQSRARLNPIVVPLIQAKTEEHARRAAAEGRAEAEHAETGHAETEHPETGEVDGADGPLE